MIISVYHIKHPKAKNATLKVFEYLPDGIWETVQILYTTFYQKTTEYIGSSKLTLLLKLGYIRDSQLNSSHLSASKSQASHTESYTQSVLNQKNFQRSKDKSVE